MTDPDPEPVLCERAGGNRYDRTGNYGCPNRARWRQVYEPHQAYCGRHVRHVGRVEPIDPGASS